MKSPARILCLAAWILAFVAQLTVVYHVPESFVVSGVELAHADKMVGLHAMIFVCFELALAIVAYFAGRWGAYLAALTAVIYWIRWFPLKPVLRVGPVAVAKGMYLIASNPNVGWSASISNFVLPILLLVVIVMVMFEVRRRTSSTTSALGSP